MGAESAASGPEGWRDASDAFREQHAGKVGLKSGDETLKLIQGVQSEFLI